MPRVQRIGHIAKLQVQRVPLKVPAPADAKHHRVFDPSGIVAVSALALSPEGVHGLVDGGDSILDVHNTAHPQTRNVRGVNGVSVGFTSHYAAMRDRFGDHIDDGRAGENILVSTDDRIDEDRLRGGLAIQTHDGQLARLERIVIAEPCVEFTRYALRLGPSDAGGEQVTEGLQFLRVGTRGFYATFVGTRAIVRPGDSVFVVRPD
jgi:hypothetical protein